ncbi:ABC transporter ATP-binding protein [Haloarchaeobius litoreus]|uniref:Molybdate/tungstate import ATP-binding protein WtpC n=1 Tax=Haloarchaeobius litoreus TaxID=755306 RepID=A0ABD6DQI7_9EURY
MAELTLDGVSVRYGDAVALSDVHLDVADGEFFTLVGPSGCGKTTTLRTIAGFEEPDAGSVRFGGREMTGVPPEGRDVGVVFQNYALFPHMTVAENVGYGLRFHEVDDPDSRVAELLSLVDLDGFEDRDPTELSGGQQQRVSLARALAPEPDVLLLDEPMSALDARLREELRREVKRIQTELGITTVYVTHDQEEALAISDRVAVMHDGRVEQVGTPREVYREPGSRFVASFVGENNLFDGERVADGVRVDGTTFTVDGLDAGSGHTTLCVRPEHLRRDAPENRFSVTVEQSEFLGEATRVHCDWDGRTVVWRTDDGVPERGERVELGFAPEHGRLL